MKIYLGILFILGISLSASAQQATQWKNYTNMSNIFAISASGNEIWAATSGGGFSYNLANKSFFTLHKADGLNGINLTAVTVDKYGKIWFGSAEGIIDVYNPKDQSIKSIFDISNYSEKSIRQINELQAIGDTIYAVTSLGISLIDAQSFAFISNTTKFANQPSNTSASDLLLSKLIYISFDAGFAIQKQGATNLSAPDSWNVFTTLQGLPANTVNKAVNFKDTIIIATAGGLSYFNGDSCLSFLPQFHDNIKDLLVAGDSLLILTDNTVNYYYSGEIVKNIYFSSTVSKLYYSKSTGLLAASNNGIIQAYGNTNTSIDPNGPEANQFPSMAVDNDGNLWCASGSDRTGKGFYKFDGTTWTNYNRQTMPSLPSNFYYVAYAAPDNSVYLGNWGSGFLRIKNGTFAQFDTNKTGMLGINTGPIFLVITGFGTDSQNDLWVLNYGSVNLKTLNAYTPDSTWYNFYVPSTGSQYNDQYYNLAIDQFDTKWFSSLSEGRSGLFYFNENKTFTNSNDDAYGYLTTNNGLNSSTINSIVVDQNGDVWVGTSLGVNIISNTQSIVAGSVPQLSITSVFTLREQTVNCLAVDPINQKWVGTNQGLLLVNSDGTELLAAYNTQNSPLLSNDITSITIDKNTGTVYAGTDQGLTAFKTSAVQPKDTFTKLFFYPSPFILKNGTNKLTIDGLIRDSEIKIITINGRLIKDFSSPGGRVAYWDGTDSNGNLVSSGIYLVVAFGKDGTNVFTGKVAVIHQ